MLDRDYMASFGSLVKISLEIKLLPGALFLRCLIIFSISAREIGLVR